MTEPKLTDCIALEQGLAADLLLIYAILSRALLLPDSDAIQRMATHSAALFHKKHGAVLHELAEYIARSRVPVETELMKIYTVVFAATEGELPPK